MKYPQAQVKDVVIAVTYRCNSRCLTCNIWKSNAVEELDYRHYAKLPVNLKNIGLTGGEPTLREDLADLIGAIRSRCKRAKLTLSTNGLLIEKIQKRMREIYKIDKSIGIAVSVDGLSEINDRMRGVPGSFGLATGAIKVLRSIGFRDIRVAFNICDENIQDISEVYRLSRKMKAAFTCSLAQNSGNYFQKKDNVFTKTGLLKEELNRIILSELNSFSPKKWFMSYYVSGLYHLHVFKKRLLKCDALRDFFFIDPGGDIYPCIFRSEILGNLKTINDFSQFWFSGKVAEMRERTGSCPTACWQLCTVRTPILNNIFPVSLWVLRKKILASLRLNAL